MISTITQGDSTKDLEEVVGEIGLNNSTIQKPYFSVHHPFGYVGLGLCSLYSGYWGGFMLYGGVNRPSIPLLLWGVAISSLFPAISFPTEDKKIPLTSIPSTIIGMLGSWYI